MQRHIKFIMMTSTNTLLVLVGLVSLYLLASCNAAALKGLQKSGAGQKWKNCSKNEDRAKILDINLSSTTLKRGGTLIGNVTYFLKEDVDDINVDFYVKHGVIPIYGNSVDLCKFPVNLACPLKAGPGFVVIEYPIPQFENVGQYLIHAVLKDKDDNELACFELNLTIKD